MIIGSYDPPVDDRLLYFIARQLDIYGIGDIDELVQEGRIRVWQLWQERQWVRGMTAMPSAWYAKAAKRRMQTILYKHTRTFGDTPRPGYVDALNHITDRIDAEGFVEPRTEIPFELLDRMPGDLLGGLV
jgi:hypothetical protein